MPHFDLEPLMRLLAAEFKRRDMRHHIASLRDFYRRYRARRRHNEALRRPLWTEDLVIEWLLLFRIPPFDHVLPVLAPGAPCPACKKSVTEPRPAVDGVFPGGYVRFCPHCRERWLVLDDA